MSGLCRQVSGLYNWRWPCRREQNLLKAEWFITGKMHSVCTSWNVQMYCSPPHCSHYSMWVFHYFWNFVAGGPCSVNSWMLSRGISNPRWRLLTIVQNKMYLASCMKFVLPMDQKQNDCNPRQNYWARIQLCILYNHYRHGRGHHHGNLSHCHFHHYCYHFLSINCVQSGMILRYSCFVWDYQHFPLQRDAAHIAQGELEKGEQEQKDPLRSVWVHIEIYSLWVAECCTKDIEHFGLGSISPKQRIMALQNLAQILCFINVPLFQLHHRHANRDILACWESLFYTLSKQTAVWCLSINAKFSSCSCLIMQRILYQNIRFALLRAGSWIEMGSTLDQHHRAWSKWA